MVLGSTNSAQVFSTVSEHLASVIQESRKKSNSFKAPEKINMRSVEKELEEHSQVLESMQSTLNRDAIKNATVFNQSHKSVENFKEDLVQYDQKLDGMVRLYD
jgi:uncharacterized coiled-coil DUF342 family protein